jgi:hypothetical protein
MAKKKKRGSAALLMAVPSSSSENMSTDISTAENGFIVNVSGNKGGKNPSYFSKRFIATSRPQALRLAAHHMASSPKAKGGKNGKRKASGKP